jgi:hypothetical protein
LRARVLAAVQVRAVRRRPGALSLRLAPAAATLALALWLGGTFLQPPAGRTLAANDSATGGFVAQYTLLASAAPLADTAAMNAIGAAAARGVWRNKSAGGD